MIQNLGSNPKISCNIITEVVIIMNFLYLISVSFIISSNLNPYMKAYYPLINPVD